jgi:Lipocalin-like domain
MNQPTRVMPSVMVLLCLVSTLVPAKADDKDKLVGSWRMVAFKVQASDTGETKDALGPKPQGRMILTASGFITNYRVADGRKPAQTDAERAQLLRTMAAWTGRYRVEGNRFIVKTESAWNEEGTGSERPRTFVLDGNRLTLTTVVPRSNFFEGRPATGNEYFEREE